MKLVQFRGSALEDLRAFPDAARQAAGYQFHRVQMGLAPTDAKPLRDIGAGITAIRIWGTAGTFRVVYVAKLAAAVYVLHCFQKKTQQTAKRDIDLVRKRYRELMKEVAP